MQTPLCPRVTNLGRLKDGSELPLRHTAAPTGALLLCELPCWSTSVSLYHLKKGWKFLKCMHNKRTFPASNRVFENQWTLKVKQINPWSQPNWESVPSFETCTSGMWRTCTKSVWKNRPDIKPELCGVLALVHPNRFVEKAGSNMTIFFDNNIS